MLKIQRAILILAGLVGVTFNPLTAVAGTPDVGGLAPQSSVCSTWQSWEGQNYDTKASANWAPRGKVRHCTSRYLLGKDDAGNKYFFVYAESEYTLTAGKPAMPAKGYIYVKSSVAAASNVYDATDSYTSSKDCNDGFSISVGAGPVSASMTPKVCEDFKVNRVSRSEVGAQFLAPKVGGVRRFTTGYVMKVAKGEKPIFTVTFYKPNYKHKYDGVYWVESGGPQKWEQVF